MRSRVLRALATVVMVVLIVAVAVYPLALIVIHTPPVQRLVIARVEGIVSENINGSFHFGGYRTNIVRSISVFDVRLRSPGARSDSVAVERLKLTYFLPALLRRTVVLRRVSVEGMHAYALRDSGGELEAPLLPLPDARAPALDIIIQEVAISDVHVTYRDRPVDAIVRVDGLSGHVSFERRDSLNIRMMAGEGSVDSPWWSGPLDTAYVSASVVPPHVAVRQVLISGDGAVVHGSGDVGLSPELPIDVVLDVKASLGFFAMPGLGPGANVAGDVTADILIAGTLTDPTIEVRATGRDVSIHEYVADTLRLTGSYTEADSLRLGAFAASGLGNASLDVTAYVPGLVGAPRFGGYRFSGLLTRIDIASLRRMAGFDTEWVKGTARMRIDASGLHLDSLPASADVKLWATVPAENEPVRVVAEAALRGSEWSAEGHVGEGNRFQASGVARLPRTLGGTAEIDVRNPSVISSVLAVAPVTGRARIDARLRDVLRQPRLDAGIRSDSLAWRGVVVDSLAGLVRIRRGDVIIDAFDAVVQAALDQLAMPGTDGLRGRLTARVSAEGRLPRMSGQGTILIEDPAYRQFAADHVESVLSYANDSVRIQEITITRDSLIATIVGMVDIAAPDSRAELMASLRVNERDAGKIRAEGLWIGDSVGAAIQIAQLNPGPVFAMALPELQLSGTVRGGAVLGERLCADRAEAAFELREYGELFPDTLVYSGRLAFTENQLAARIEATSGGDQQQLIATVDAAIAGSCLGPDVEWLDGSTVSLRSERFPIGAVVASFLPGAVGTGELNADALSMLRDGEWSLSGWVSARAENVRVPTLQVEAQRMTLAAVLDGTLANPSVSTYASGRGVSYRERVAIDFFGHARVGLSAAMLDTLYGGFRDGGGFYVSGTFPLTMDRLQREGVEADFRLVDVPVAAVDPFLAQVTVERGMVNASGVLRYDQGRGLVADGEVAVADLLFKTAFCEQTIGPVALTADLNGDSVIIREARGTINDGTVSIGGFAVVGVEGLRDAQVQLSVRNVVLECQGIDRLGINRAALRLGRRNDGLVMAGRVMLGNTRYEQTVSVAQLLRGTLVRSPGRGRAPGVLGDVQLDILVDFSRNLLVESSVGRFLVDGQVRVVGSLNRVGMTGEIVLAEGLLYYLDREFVVEEGVIRQFEPFPLNPRLNITATSNVESFAIEEGEEEYSVELSVTGTLRNPNIILSSQPELGRQEIVNLLTLGSPTGAAGVSGRAAELLTAQVTSPIARLLEEWLDISDISLSGNVLGAGGNGGPRLTLRENLGSRLSVTFETAVTDLSQREVRLLFRLAPHIRISGGTDASGNFLIGLWYLYGR